LPTCYKINIGVLTRLKLTRLKPNKTYIKIGEIKEKHKHETNYWEEKETNSSLEMNWRRWKGIRIESDGATMEKSNQKRLFLGYVIGLVKA